MAKADHTGVTKSKRGLSIGVGAKIGLVVAFCLVALLSVSIIGITQMEKINEEIEGIAERDIPLTEIVTQVTVHQLEQAINFERSIRYGEEMHDHAAARPQFEKSVHEFEKLSAKVNSEIKKGEEIAQHAMDTAHKAEAKKEFAHVLEAFKTIEVHHAGYEKHAVEAIQLLNADKTSAAMKLVEQIEVEEEKLDHELEELLGNIEKFTRHAAATAEEHEKFAVKILTITSIIGFVLASLFAWFVISRLIARPLSAVVKALESLTAGETDIEIKVQAQDEIGAVAGALTMFRDTMVEARRLEEIAIQKEREEMEARAKAAQEKSEATRAAAEKQAEEARIAKERAENMARITAGFDQTVNEILGIFASASTELDAAANALTQTATKTSEMSSSVASASGQASANVQTVAAATEELSSSVNEISRQVAESTRITASAVEEAKNANAKVQGLSEAANTIGEVVSLITDIASQTNLLALNATIEAARAGEAGKGFAVVATEVKSLADQTAKATEDISSQIAAIQAATGEAVSAIDSIGKTIETVDEISSSIAAAVEEQGTATNDIAVNVQQAARGTQEVDSGITGVNEAAGETGSASSQVMATSQELSSQANFLRTAVDSFLSDVKAA